MEILIAELLFYFGLAVLFVYSEPMIHTKRMMGFKEENYDKWNKIGQGLYRLVTCLFCSSFWITLCISQSFIMAVMVSTLAYLWENR